MMDTDLTQIIKSDQPLTEEHYKFFLYQLLRGLKYIHSAGIVHRDLLSANNYTTAVDMWSVGCIFAEMLQRKPFLPGTDTKNQIELTCEYLGSPELENMKHIPE